MNRGRFSHHQDRDIDGLHQVLHMPMAGQNLTGGKPLRKTPITRPELMPRPQIVVKPPRLPRQMSMMSRSPERKSTTVATLYPNPLERTPAPRCNNNFLPRVATLANNSHNKNKPNPQSSMTRSKSAIQKPLKHFNPNEMKQLTSTPKQVQMQAKANLAGIHGSTSSLNSSSSFVETRKTRMPEAYRLPEEQNQSFVYLCKPAKRDMNDPLYPSDEDFDELEDLGLSIDESTDTQSSVKLQTDRKKLQEVVQEQQQEKDKKQEHQMEPDNDKKKLMDEIELFCKKSPALQREIHLLQELSEQLEVTIAAGKKSPGEIVELDHSEMIISIDSPNCTYHTPRSNLSLYPYEDIPIVHIDWRCIEMRAIVEHKAAGRLNIRSFGYIQEYRIEMKTLTELKTAGEQQIFYMPLAKDGGLQRTSFRLLRENPNLLLKQLRPLTPARPFNLLEQDAMFFHHMLSYGDPALEQQLLPRETGGAQPPLVGFDSGHSVHGQSAEVKWSSADVELMLNNLEKAKLKLQLLLPSNSRNCSVDESLQKLHSSTTSLKTRNQPLHLLCSKYKPRHRPRPVSPVKTLDVLIDLKPKRRLLTTVVCIVQIFVFAVLVLAISYPDIRC